ncbi:MAG: aminopeptidase P family protein [Mogibacterium sp.]|nr:aminopeptidase P family protein [Mogibacterium sp.]
MDKSKLNRITSKMQEKGLSQMIISDPVSIFYLIEKWIFPGERFHALYINVNGDNHFVMNRLFPQNEDLGVPVTYYDDIEDGVAVMAQFTDKDAALGIDKNLPSKFLLRLQELGAAGAYCNGSVIFDKVRQIKSEEEQKLMTESGAKLDKVMGKLIPWVVKGLTEKELNAKCIELLKAEGFEDKSFDPITAYARGAADPHHITDDSKGKHGDCVILDIGGVWKNYCSDMTRTVFIGEYSDRQKEIYNIVLEANKRGIAAARPGAKMSDVDKAARDYITEKGFGEYFTHRTGHSIGMECHETGDVSSANDEIIEVGQCFSVEPGIYLYDEGIGVRIEDIVLVTEDGCVTLNNYPKEEMIVVPDGE